LLNEKKTNNTEQEVTLTPEQNALLDRSMECMADINNILHMQPHIMKLDHWAFRDAYKAAAYLLSKASTMNDPLSVSFDDFGDLEIDMDIIQFASAVGVDQAWENLRGLIKKYPTHLFNLSILWTLQEDPDDPFDFPEGVSSLVETLLDVQDRESFTDLFCEDGRLTTSIRSYCPSSDIYGYDANVNAIALSKIMTELHNDHIHYHRGDIFALLESSEIHSPVDKVFARYPLGIRKIGHGPMTEYWERVKNRIPTVSRSTSSDWIYNLFMLGLISEKGQAIGIMTNGSTWNTIDAPIRKYFVENGFVKAVINLPAKIFPRLAVGTSLIIMSHGNTAVRMIDASNLFEAGRRTNTLSDNHIQSIADALVTDSAISRLVSIEELRENDYILHGTRYLEETSLVSDGVAFDDIIKRITRGAPLNANQLDEISSAVPTEARYLMISNIQNGLIDEDLPYINGIEKKLEKYCLTNHCLIMSKNGYPYKVAVAELEEGQKILANGNLYIIEFDETKADPYYIAAYLNSEQGIAALKRITVGAVLPNVGVEQLRKIRIPLPPMEEQKKIGDAYKGTRDEILYLQLKIEKAKARMTNLLEEVDNA